MPMTGDNALTSISQRRTYWLICSISSSMPSMQ